MHMYHVAGNYIRNQPLGITGVIKGVCYIRNFFTEYIYTDFFKR